MKAATKLCRDIGYRSAGTVEYMYQPSTGKYYFLELNPRLQAETQPRCGRDAAEMQPRRSRGAAETQPRRSRGAAETQPRRSRDAAEVQPRLQPGCD